MKMRPLHTEFIEDRQASELHNVAKASHGAAKVVREGGEAAEVVVASGRESSNQRGGGAMRKASVQERCQ